MDSTTPSIPTPSPAPSGGLSGSLTPSKGGFPRWGAVGIIVLVLVVGFFAFSNGSGLTGLVTGAKVAPTTEIPTPTVAPDSTAGLTANDSLLGPDNTALSKEKYIKQIYTVDRSTYNLFEKAAAYRKESLSDTKKFFYNCCDLTSEEEIFQKLPPIPSDFAELAYSLATGRLYQIGTLGEEYYKQPEWYFHTDQTALANRMFAFAGWSAPQLNYWGDYGGAAYPADQFDTVSKSKRKKFTAVVFVTNGWNIQNWVGMTMIANNNALKNFDIKISEDKTGQPYFLLGPTFPKFSRDWATRITIEGEVKDTTPPGVYVIHVNPIAPPTELNAKWSSEHIGIYTPYGFFSPDTGYITLTVTVTE
jgi:hypothetical protein